ncbi:unnamed protein product [Dibothriocephalus latus]|uniref:K Homology domain-containing protein n=1 Tax=Dibothriocephalus latus TaxID=60516 RepID=A0A3P6TAD0_DIBLA|nr:unnamed protein product [Dibothriocephalus latus]
MKIDVSHTEHSHLIGKGGQNVKAMMVDTKCHIHFPDSNRTNIFEKSNQVSISGSPADVDRARKRIRVTDLHKFYNFQIERPSQTIALYRASPVLQQIEAKWQVEVSYRHKYLYPLSDVVPLCSPVSQLSSGIVVSVRGLNAFASSVMEATHFLLYYHFGKLAYQTPVWLTLEIEPKHQAFIINHVAPRKLSDVLFETTGAKVKFPDHIGSSLFSRLLRGSTSDVSRRGFYPSRLCLPKYNPMMFGELQSRHGIKTMVTITGNVENVYLARQCIMNLLPIVLMSEITNEEFSFLERLDCSSLASTYDVALSFRTKQRQLLKVS